MGVPNLRQIEAFKAVVEAGTVSRAADMLLISQPAVSKLIAHFEHAVGFPVFDRVRGRLVLNAEGIQLFEEVERVFAGVRQIANAARAIQSSREGHLAIGAMPGFAHGFIHEITESFLKKYPKLRITIHARSTQLIADWLVNGQLDIGFASIPEDHPLLECTVLARHSLICLLPPGHRLVKKETINFQDIAEEPFVAFQEGSMTRIRVERAMRDAGVEIEPRIVATSAPTVCEFVARGAGVALCAPVYARPYADRIAQKPFEPAIPTELVMATPRNHRNQKLTRALAREAQAVVDAQFGAPTVTGGASFP